MENRTDLIKDRALEIGEDDLFDHKTISTSMVNLIRSISPPANIALYGPWGVGKSGLSNLIEARLNELDEGFKYVRFDAFKYAENPLRKHILSVMSEELLSSSASDKFKKSLYQNESTDKIKIPTVTIISMVLTMLGVMIVIAFAFSLIASLFPLQNNGLQLDYFEKVGKYIPEMILPSSILSAFVSLWGKTFTTKTTQSAPSQEEEFEDQFKKLVKAATRLSKHRIVIFVDELDRCAGGDVVSALDTIRTFMDSDKCIFIVAVDRHVLSSSFKAKLSSASPLDKSNPQQGSVNEYLNKVFQYQIDMPPLKRQRLTAYASELVEGCGGVWSSESFKPKEVISILIPPSVNSPRRVKSLLNSFVIAFRIASDKSNKGKIRLLSEDMVHSLAKIVFLRNEYPRFFEHVCLEHRLPSILANAYKIDGYEIPFDIKENIADLVPKYLRFEIELYDYLSNGNYSSNSGTDHADLLRASGKQLLNYLSLTSHINIERELIFLEGIDHTNGLEPEFSSELETLAISNLTSEIAEKIAPLKSADKKKVISVLLNYTPLHDDEQTVQGQGVAITLLELIKEDPSLGAEDRNVILDRTLPYLSKLTDAPYDALTGAVMLTDGSDIDRKERVFDAVLSTDAPLKNGELASLIIKLAFDTSKRFDQSYSKIFSNFYTDPVWNEKVFSQVAELSEGKSRRILSAALPEIRDDYLEAKETDEDPELSGIPPKAIIDSMKLAVETFRDGGRDDLVERSVWFLDGDRDIDWFRFILVLMRRGWRPNTKKLAQNLLNEFGYFIPNKNNLRSDWLKAMNPDLFDAANDIEIFDSIENQVLKDFLDYGLEEKYFSEIFPSTLTSLQEFKKQVGFVKPSVKFTEKIIEEFKKNLNVKVVNQAELDSVKHWFSMVSVVINFDLIIDPIKVSDAVLQESVKLLKLPGVALSPLIRTSIFNCISESICIALKKASLEELKVTVYELNSGGFILTEKELVFLIIVLEGRIKDLDKSSTSPPYEDDYINKLINGSDHELNQKIAAFWLMHYGTDVERFFSLISKFRRNYFFHKDLTEAADKYLLRLSSHDHEKILSALLSSSSYKVNEAFVKLLGFSRLRESFVEKELIRASKTCQNVDDRKLVLNVWSSSEISDESVNENLGRKVFLKFYKENKVSANLALSNFELISNISKEGQEHLKKELLKTRHGDLYKRASKLIKQYKF